MEVQKLNENKKKILEWVESLSHSQGFYCRLLQKLRQNEAALTMLAEQDFKDSVDMVLFLEC